jgi:hypothetical protein
MHDWKAQRAVDGDGLFKRCTRCGKERDISDVPTFGG